MAFPTLFQWGLITFSLQLNVHAMDHFTGTDFARKEVMESSPTREWVGERDEEVVIRGRIFPLAIGGWANLEAFEAARREGIAHVLMRGGAVSGDNMGWFVCEDLRRGHEHLAPNGIGKVINFEARFGRVDTPAPADYYSSIFTMMQGT